MNEMNTFNVQYREYKVLSNFDNVVVILSFYFIDLLFLSLFPSHSVVRSFIHSFFYYIDVIFVHSSFLIFISFV